MTNEEHTGNYDIVSKFKPNKTVKISCKVKSTKEGKLYITTKDFFSQKKIQEQIKKGLKLFSKKLA